ncbi:hypothetical protein NGA_0356800, partial [Nannochloropsis gaditana CCMP526]|uniref:uncharacterized protein n=1 Tax=Nannochloropsis gaditana (strain CCMP526) TaxID=1093141 RepID=UPI00029F79A0
MAGGRANFVRCTFWDFQYLAPLTDHIRFGDNLFLLRGEAYFTGCILIFNTIIGLDVGFGCGVEAGA